MAYCTAEAKNAAAAVAEVTESTPKSTANGAKTRVAAAAVAAAAKEIALAFSLNPFTAALIPKKTLTRINIPMKLLIQTLSLINKFHMKATT